MTLKRLSASQGLYPELLYMVVHNDYREYYLNAAFEVVAVSHEGYGAPLILEPEDDMVSDLWNSKETFAQYRQDFAAAVDALLKPEFQIQAPETQPQSMQ